MNEQICYIHLEINGHKKLFSTRESLDVCKSRILVLQKLWRENGYTENKIHAAILKAIDEGNYEIVTLKSPRTRRQKAN